MAGPLDILGVVACAFILAAHQVDGMFCAEAWVGDAFQLREGGDAAVSCLLAATEGEGLDLCCVVNFCFFVECQREGEGGW